MIRRDFITLLGGAAAWPLVARGEELRKLYRVGFLWDSPTVFPDALEAFAQGLRDLGYVEGRNITIEPVGGGKARTDTRNG
jgi:putative ABC transport system substrate-binding protein